MKQSKHKERKRLHMLELRRRREIRSAIYKQWEIDKQKKKEEEERLRELQIQEQEEQLMVPPNPELSSSASLSPSSPEEVSEESEKELEVLVKKEPKKVVKRRLKAVEKEITEPLYFSRMRSPGWYDIIDQAGKVQNVKAMRLATAEKRIKRWTDAANS